MGFHYERVFVVVNEKNDIIGIYRNKYFALESLPTDKRSHPMEITKHGDWQYGKVSPWKILTKKVKDSSGIIA